MTKGMTSLAALLGLVAVAGYQNREKIGEFVKGLNASGTGGVGDLVDHLKNTGLGKAADSWIAKGPNAPVTDTQVGDSLGTDLIDILIKQTGLSRYELLARLSKILPEAVDKMTPDGTRKCAEPSASTGTVPSTHLPGSSAVRPRLGWFMTGCVLGGTAMMRSDFT